MKFNIIIFATALSATLFMSSCLGDDEPDYSEWEARNTEFVTTAEAETENGRKVYTRMAPSWAPSAFILVNWLNDRSKTANNLQPLDNSLVRVKYALDNIDGTRIDDSYSLTTYGDSIYQTKPMNNITGFWFLLTQMHEGDHVKCIMPAISAYGNVSQGTLQPYSTLVYDVELVSIPGFETPL